MLQTDQGRTGGGRWRMRLAVCAAVAMAAFGGATAAAQADPFTLSVDHAVIDLGALTGLEILDASTGPATFNGTVTGNQVTIPPEGLNIPPKSVTTPFPVTITITANGPVTGTYDAATGSISLQASLKAETTGAAACQISPINVTLSTGNKSPYAGEPFSGGLTGPGALSTSWAALPDATGSSVTCSLIGNVAAGNGGLWLANAIAAPKTCAKNPTIPTCAAPVVVDPCVANPNAPGCTGVSPCVANPNAAGCKADPCVANPNAAGCDKSSPCAVNPNAAGCTKTNPCVANPKASGCTNSPTERKAALSLKAAKKSLTAKTGKTVKLTLTVKNTGGTAAKSAKVCVKLPTKKVLKTSSCKKIGSLAAGASKKVAFSVKTTAKSRKHTYKLTFTASASGVAAKKATTKLSVR